MIEFLNSLPEDRLAKLEAALGCPEFEAYLAWREGDLVPQLVNGGDKDAMSGRVRELWSFRILRKAVRERIEKLEKQALTSGKAG